MSARLNIPKTEKKKKMFQTRVTYMNGDIIWHEQMFPTVKLSLYFLSFFTFTL